MQYSAASFVETINSNSLTMDPDEFVARMVDAGVPDMHFLPQPGSPPPAAKADAPSASAPGPLAPSPALSGLHLRDCLAALLMVLYLVWLTGSSGWLGCLLTGYQASLRGWLLHAGAGDATDLGQPATSRTGVIALPSRAPLEGALAAHASNAVVLSHA